jgi:anti-sigma regulatory factor (Ser/Thr protein kinase)
MSERHESYDVEHRDDRQPIELAVGASAVSVGAARNRLRTQLEAWRCGNIDDVTLVFSELATNALRHAGSPSSVVITHGDDEIRLAVHDASHAVPHVTPASPMPGGYGLVIVDRVSERWGWEQTASGKTVWSVIRCRDCG